jgi:pimeloyl-ACP methyl ester carboxylesterase
MKEVDPKEDFMNAIPYSPRKVDLFYPARSANFFAAGLPDTEAALCAEMARLAYCRLEPYFQFDRVQMSAALTGIGFTCQFFESTGTPEGVGTHAFLALHDDPDPAKKLAVVSFRGTDAADPTDLADDAEFLQCEWPQGGLVHRGFSEALAHVLPALKSALDKVRGRVLFTGHSLGAALATLLASARPPDYLYTIGSPRVGDAAFVATLTGINNRRFVDCCDIVTRVPPESLPPKLKYAHYGVPYYIDRHRLITENPDDAFIDKDRLAAEEEYLLEYAWRVGNVGVRDLADHATINYVTAVAADVSQPELAKWKLTLNAPRRPPASPRAPARKH